MTFPWKESKEKKKNSNDVEVERKKGEILEFVSLVKPIGRNFSFSSLLIFFAKLFLFQNFLHSALCILLFSLLQYFEAQKKEYILKLGNKTSIILVCVKTHGFPMAYIWII